jgi:hypothetical protein
MRSSEPSSAKTTRDELAACSSGAWGHKRSPARITAAASSGVRLLRLGNFKLAYFAASLQGGFVHALGVGRWRIEGTGVGGAHAVHEGAYIRDQVQQVAVVDLLPGGVEPVYNLPPEPEAASSEESEGDDSEYVETSEDTEEADAWQAPIGETDLSNWQPDYVDVRDDRVVLYGTALRDVGTFVYRVRATNAGTFNTPPAYAEGSL